MVLASLGLPHDHTIVVESERCKIGKSSLGVFHARRRRVEILDPQKEPALGGAGEQPSQQRSTQIAEMQSCARTRGEPSVGHDSVQSRSTMSSHSDWYARAGRDFGNIAVTG